MSSFSPKLTNNSHHNNNNNVDHVKPPIVTTVVAVNKGKSSVYAVRWAIDILGTSNPNITLVHVVRRHYHDDAAASAALENDVRELFASFQGYSARKGVRLLEVVVEENDLAKALLEYVANNYITNMVIGASSRNALSKKLKNNTLSDTLIKSVPDFCNVYVISKWKVAAMKRARRTIVNTVVPPRSLSAPSASLDHHNSGDGSSGGASFRAMRKLSMGSSEPMAYIPESPHYWGPAASSMENHDNSAAAAAANGLMRSMSSDGSPSERTAITDLSGPADFGSVDVSDGNYDFSVVMSPKHATPSPRDLEAEMKRLKLELRQTINLYSNACKEALSAKKKAKLLEQLKMEEERKFEEARNAEQAALAMAEKEKNRCRAAIDAAEKAQKIAEKEALRRKHAELKARREAEEKDKALNVLHHNDHRYRRYSIKEIEEATERFSADNKIGEGGYGPVFKGVLDYTPVAIKILRPDANQGRKQFHQEVEVLCSMRHPNMVLLLGACPEYGCLVYEYMHFGSLEDRLFQKGNSPPIPWKKRFRIASEIATALLFLHQAKPEPLVHRDLKPANILLDRTYKSKISDVGLARLVPPSVADSVTQYHLTCAAGTFNYIDPEYQQTGKLTPKSDIYSLGIMLLQIVTAKPAGGLTHHVRVAIQNGKFEEILDPAITDWPIEQTLDFVNIALQCAELSKKDRPDLGGVVVPELLRLRDFGSEAEATGSSSNSSTATSQEPGSSSPPTTSSDPQDSTSSLETENSGSSNEKEQT